MLKSKEKKIKGKDTELCHYKTSLPSLLKSLDKIILIYTLKVYVKILHKIWLMINLQNCFRIQNEIYILP